MPWHAYTPEPVSSEDAVSTSVDLTNSTFTDDYQIEATNKQVKAAQKAVAALLKGLGSKGDLYRVEISGHANAEDRPVEGWGNETITVSVIAVPAPAEE